MRDTFRDFRGHVREARERLHDMREMARRSSHADQDHIAGSRRAIDTSHELLRRASHVMSDFRNSRRA